MACHAVSIERLRVERMPFVSHIPPEKRIEARNIYETTKLSCRAIGDKIGIDGNTITTWKVRGGWTRQGELNKQEKQFAAKLETRLASKLENKSERLADRATALIERTLNEAEEWLELLAEKRRNGTMNADDALKLISAWKIPIEMSRKALRLDDGPSATKIGLFLPVNFVQAHSPGLNLKAPGGEIIDVATVAILGDKTEKQTE
jgi:hypothetical protein